MQSYIGQSGSFTLMKNLNLEKVYRTIVLNAPVSRAEISRLTGLNKVTVSNCIKNLIAEDIVSEEGVVSAENGRPPMMLMLSESFGVIIGVEVSGISTNIMITDLRGKILERTIRDPKLYSPEELAALIHRIVDDCRTKFKTTRGVVGIGIALPYNYNQKQEIEDDPALPEWKDVDAEQFFNDSFPDIPLEILSTSQAGAIGEVHFGSSTPSTYLAYIHGNWTLKMDVYDGGETYASGRGFVGRFGRMQICRGDNGEMIALDNVASMESLIDELYPGDERSRLEKVMDLHERQKDHDPEVDVAIKKMLDKLALGLFNLLQLFSPDAICIGGYLGATLYNGGCEDELNKKLIELVGPENDKGRRVTASQFGMFNVGFGCISWIRDNIITYYFGDEQ